MNILDTKFVNPSYDSFTFINWLPEELWSKNTPTFICKCPKCSELTIIKTSGMMFGYYQCNICRKYIGINKEEHKLKL